MPQTSMFSAVPTIISRFHEVAQRSPSSIAIVADSGSLTYQDLSHRATLLASRIWRAARGSGPAVITAHRSPELIVAMLAAMDAGLVYTALDPSWSPELKTRILDDLQPSIVLAEATVHGSPWPQILLGSVSDGNDVGNVSDRAQALSATDVACIFFTSGTSGTPKGVTSTHQATMRLFQDGAPCLTVGAGRCMAVAAAVSWDAFSLEVWSMLTSGGTCVLVEDNVLTPVKLRSLIADHGLTSLWLTASVFNLIVDLDLDAFSGLDEVLTGGERLSVPHVRRFLNRHAPAIRLINGYGPVEATVFVTTHLISPADLDREGGIPIGRVVPGTNLYVVDESGSEASNGTVGELLVGGVAVSPGYLGLPELNAQKFEERIGADGSVDRIYRTGDLVVRSSEGLFEFRGRADREVKVRGVRVELDELESLVRNVEGVSAAAVVPIFAKNNELAVDRLRLFFSGTATIDLIRGILLGALPPAAVPKIIEHLDQLPLLTNGKLDRLALEKLPETKGDAMGQRGSPLRSLTSTEQRLTTVWQSVLDIDDIAVTDDYYADLGGDSLRAVELLTVVHQQWGVSLPLGALALSPTIEAFSALIDQGSRGLASQSESFDVLVSLRTTGSAVPLFCVHGGSGNVASFPRLLRGLPADQPFYAFQWDGLDGSRGTSGIVALASLYVDRMRAEYPAGPVRIAGQCVGGLIALEMVHQFVSAGRDVELLVMFDSPNLFSPEFTDGHSRELAYKLVKMPLAERIRRLRRFSARWAGYAGGRVAREYGGEHAINTMIRSVRKYEPKLASVPTLFFASGETVANKIGLAGSWADTAFGWERSRAEQFEIHHVPGGHSDLLYSPETIAILSNRLSTL